MRTALLLPMWVSLALTGCSGAGEKSQPAAAGEKGAGAKRPAEEKGTPVSRKELEKLLADWRGKQKGLASIVTRFVCSEENALLAEPQTTRGVIRIKKPDGYRREVIEKKGGREELVGLMILKPPYLWVYTPRSRRAERIDLSKMGKGADSNPLKALGDIISFDLERIKKRFEIRAFKLKDGSYRLEYAAREEGAIGEMAKVRVWMKPGGRFPLKMETTSADEEVRTETYTGTEFDQDLPDSLYTFRRPRGVRLIRLPE